MPVWILILVWSVIALIIDNVVKETEGEIQGVVKNTLFYIVTFPVFWLQLLRGFYTKYWHKSWLSKVGLWFKE